MTSETEGYVTNSHSTRPVFIPFQQVFFKHQGHVKIQVWPCICSEQAPNQNLHAEQQIWERRGAAQIDALVCSRRHRRLIAAGISRGSARTAVETSDGVLSLPRCALLPGCQKWIICHPPAVFEARNKINVDSSPCRAAVYSVCYVFNKNLAQEQWAAVCVWCRGARAASSISYRHRFMMSWNWNDYVTGWKQDKTRKKWILVDKLSLILIVLENYKW